MILTQTPSPAHVLSAEIAAPDAQKLAAYAASDAVLLLSCTVGRMLCKAGAQCYVLCSGTCAVLPQKLRQNDLYFPTNRFQGVLLCMPHAVLPDAVPQVFRMTPALSACFADTSNCSALPELLAEAMPADECRFAATQYRYARAAYRELSGSLNRHIPIETLARQGQISPTHLKNSFRLVYGDSLYAYVRTQKMLAAAELLVQSSRTVLDIAGEFGYDNGSKFAKAFQTVLGVSPRQFRSAPSLPPESIRHERRAIA